MSDVDKIKTFEESGKRYPGPGTEYYLPGGFGMDKKKDSKFLGGSENVQSLGFEQLGKAAGYLAEMDARAADAKEHLAAAKTDKTQEAAKRVRSKMNGNVMPVSRGIVR